MSTSKRGLMAVQTVRRVVCDKCGDSAGGIERLAVTFPGGNRRTFDLCSGCVAPILELQELLPQMGKTGPRRHAQPVFSEAELDKRVQQAKRRARTRKTVST